MSHFSYVCGVQSDSGCRDFKYFTDRGIPVFESRCVRYSGASLAYVAKSLRMFNNAQLSFTVVKE